MSTVEATPETITVLIIEDSPGQSRLMERTLQREGMNVSVARDGETALTMVEQRRFDVALIDHALPGMSGLQVLSALIAHSSDIVPMMVTGSGSEEVAAKALEQGAAAYIIKDVEGRYRSLMATSIRRTIEQWRLASAKASAEAHLGEALRDLQTRNEALQGFTQLLAHDLKAPARQVRQLAEWALEEMSDEISDELNDFLTKIVERGRALTALIDESLVLMKSASKGIEREETDLQAMVLEIMTRLWPSLNEAKAEITLEPLPTVSVDASQMSHVFQNLLENARKYRKPGEQAEIKVWAEPDDRGVLVKVSDKGIGFSDHVAHRLFEPFYRDPGAVKMKKGSGLGLSICKTIVERHGGWIQAEGTPGEGACFTLFIPNPA